MTAANGPHAEPQEQEKYSVFELAGKLFGIAIMKSREVMPLPRFTPLPNSDSVFYGVFNLRGEIFPLVDISTILGLHAKQIQSDDMLILVDDAQDFVVGMLVDKLHSVVSAASSEIMPPTGLVTKTLEPFASGVLEKGNNLIHILDLEQIFRAREILAHY